MIRPNLILTGRTEPIVQSQSAIRHPAFRTSECGYVRKRRLTADNEVELLEDGDSVNNVPDIWREVSHDGQSVIIVKLLGIRSNLKTV